jgi:hypothetical protein
MGLYGILTIGTFFAHEGFHPLDFFFGSSPGFGYDLYLPYAIFFILDGLLFCFHNRL